MDLDEDLGSEDDWLVIEALGYIRKELCYSYPYCAGTVSIRCNDYPKKVLERILKYFKDREASIVIYPGKKLIVIKDFMTGF
jgi:hypothetical protein